MSLLGKGALAMWWSMAAPVRADFEDWHSHEHFPERLRIPGFRRATRWASADGGEGIFVMYELQEYETVSSAPYLERLNAPTPWSTRMMPYHRDMVRTQCRVLESAGGAVARHALTVRLSPAAGRTGDLRSGLRALIDSVPSRPGLVGAHLLQHQAPPIAATTEQKIRGSADQAADWVLVCCGYDLAVVQALAHDALSAQGLARLGASDASVRDFYTLSYSATPADVP